MRCKRFKFSLRALLIAGALLPIAAAALNRLRLYDAEYFRALLFWAVVAFSALVLRVPGAMIGGRIGTVAHHSLAWFTASLGAATVILVAHAMHSPATILRDIPGGLGAVSLICGMASATVAELGWVLFTAVRTELTATQTEIRR